MGQLGSILEDGIKEEDKEQLDVLINEYKPRINAFYLKADQILKNNSLQSNFSFLSNNHINSIFDQIKYSQISEKNLDLTADIQIARNSIVLQNNERELQELNNLIGEGYRILTEFGEKLRGSRRIQYMITFVSDSGTQLLGQRVLNLQQFTESFSLNSTGKIFFNLNGDNLSESFLNNSQWESLISYQKERRKKLLKTIGNQKKARNAIENFKKYIELSEGKLTEETKNIIRGAFPGDKKRWIRKRIYWSIEEKNVDKILENILKAVNYRFNTGWMIELGAALVENDKKFDTRNMNKLYEEDNIAFYKQGDFLLHEIEYQSKLNNASVNLSTIINGMKKLTTILASYKNPVYNTAQINTDADQAEQKIYDSIYRDLVNMFTSKK